MASGYESDCVGMGFWFELCLSSQKVEQTLVHDHFSGILCYVSLAPILFYFLKSVFHCNLGLMFNLINYLQVISLLNGDISNDFTGLLEGLNIMKLETPIQHLCMSLLSRSDHIPCHPRWDAF